MAIDKIQPSLFDCFIPAHYPSSSTQQLLKIGKQALNQKELPILAELKNHVTVYSSDSWLSKMKKIMATIVPILFGYQQIVEKELKELEQELNKTLIEVSIQTIEDEEHREMAEIFLKNCNPIKIMEMVKKMDSTHLETEIILTTAELLRLNAPLFCTDEKLAFGVHLWLSLENGKGRKIPGYYQETAFETYDFMNASLKGRADRVGFTTEDLDSLDEFFDELGEEINS